MNILGKHKGKYDRDGNIKNIEKLKHKEYLHKDKNNTLGEVAIWRNKNEKHRKSK